MLKLKDVDLKGKRVLIREDFNVPLKDGQIQDDARIQSGLETIQYALAQGASRVIIVSHLGRPKEGEFDKSASLRPVADRLSQLLDDTVDLIYNWQDDFSSDAKVILLENIRFYPGEKVNDVKLSKELAQLADVVVFDAFATSHRAQASTEGIIRQAPVACMGLLMEREITALERAWQQPETPVLAVVGGAKISTKLELLKELSKRVDVLIPGGGIANTLLKAAGFEIGESLFEPDLLRSAESLLASADCEILLPTDVVVATELSEDADVRTCQMSAVNATDKIFDIGPNTAKHYAEKIIQAKTIIWNGPVGVFEFKPFAEGTQQVAQAIADAEGYSLAGGGDTLSALKQFGLLSKISYVSTGGGALLTYLEGKDLPALKALGDHSH